MHASSVRIGIRRLVGIVLLASLPGCQSNNIPLIEFPQGAPPPPAPSKDAKLPQGSNTSRGAPST